MPGKETKRGILAEFGAFLREDKKWWLWPLITLVIVLGALIAMGGTDAAPFIYTRF
jgi:hypothetical protein